MEKVTPIDRHVPDRLLRRAVVRLDLRKYPEQLAEIDREMMRRRERRAA